MMTHGKSTKIIGQEGFWLGPAVTIFAILLALFAIPWATYLDNLRLLRALCLDDALDVPEERLTVQELPVCSLPAAWRDGTAKDPCQKLWMSRLEAPGSLDQAGATLLEAGDCPRPDLVAAWSGELAWLQGDPQRAEEAWAQLSDKHLLGWGQSLILQNEMERARLMLDLVLRRGASEQGGPEMIRAMSILGDSLRLERRWDEASRYYEVVWRAKPGDSRTAFFLGMSYRHAGRPGEAVDVLEAGLESLSPVRPGAAANFHVQLGLVYAELGAADRAFQVFQTALDLLDRAKEPNLTQRQFILKQLERLPNRPEG
jgi:tetratricopeptide (TPR) repeat protein